MCDIANIDKVCNRTKGKGSCSNMEIINTTSQNDTCTRRQSANIGEALDLLRKELILLQDQDVLLLKQLMNVHYSIRMLKRKLCRRTNSFTTLAPTLINSYSNASKTLPPRSSLSRVMSEPSRSLIYQRSFSITEEDYEEEDELAESFNSGDSDAQDPLKFSLNVDPEVSALLTDMPKSLRRKYLTSLNHNSYAIPKSESFDELEEETKSNNTFSRNNSMKSFTRTDSSKNQKCSSIKCSSNIKKLPVPNDLCSKPVNGDYTYDSDSSGGIEITAL